MKTHAIQHALLSVSDKTGIETLAKALHQSGVKIIASSGTASLIKQHEIPATEVSAYTGFPEIMDGRVKTLHPKIHGGLLARGETDAAAMTEHDIASIDLLAVNLYPFLETVNQKHTTVEEAIEQIDIGGVALIRAAAKNYRHVIVLVDPADYTSVISTLNHSEADLSIEKRMELAAKAFAHVAAYDAAISKWFAKCTDGFADSFAEYPRHSMLRYGENPHQQAAFYQSPYRDIPQLLQGKALSFNNLLDSDSANKIVFEVAAEKQFACAIVKHNNPCGVAISDTMRQAYQQAFDTDPTAAFGGIIAFNQELDADTAQAIIDQSFVEVITAPRFSQAALAVLSEKKNIRALLSIQPADDDADVRSIAGGMLVQQSDTAHITAKQLQVVSQHQPSADELRDMLFAWRVAKHTRSNAIVFAENQTTTGIGAGQMSRVDSVRVAAKKSAARTVSHPAGNVMASDGFFPFGDGIEEAHKAGIKAIIQPGGSQNDSEIIAIADRYNMAMAFTGIRHFKH